MIQSWSGLVPWNLHQSWKITGTWKLYPLSFGPTLQPLYVWLVQIPGEWVWRRTIRYHDWCFPRIWCIFYTSFPMLQSVNFIELARCARVASLFANFYVCTDSVIAILFQMVQTMCRLCFYICHILWIIFWHTNLGEKRNILCINIYFHIIHALQCSWPCSCYWLPYLCPTVLFAKKNYIVKPIVTPKDLEGD